ncbi:S8 family serine peptidase [Streptomyces sp. Isolate_45]|uniref:S8 family serine peptidase n=1 Tax=Streptomyces sp. Isolate_45 TaxID=2950111 RepID=UPI0024819A69|nr:S8 family serine peptidase [Streptomyces sp. Isolate_45]MDA5281080.1 S8 family serine peptidase [Streptomyces sp. Isolate_45]
MARSAGAADLRVGLVDGPVMVSHPGLSRARIEWFCPRDVAELDADDVAALHATSTAGVLVAERGSGALGICPGVTLVTRSIFRSPTARSAGSATWVELADALVELADAGARIVNMSLSLESGMSKGHHTVKDALDYVAAHGVIVVAAAGNDGAIDGTVVTRHRSVLPVVTYNLQGWPGRMTNIGRSIGQRGIGVVADGLMSLGPGGRARPYGGTSAAAAVVTGAAALIWSELPKTSPEELISAMKGNPSRRTSVVPPLMNAWQAFESLLAPRN